MYCYFTETPRRALTIPRLKEARERSAAPRTIPRIIHQTHETASVDWDIYAATMQLISLNKNHEYRFYTNADRRDFLADKFGEDSPQVQAYLKINNGTWRADFFRVCVLYAEGGVYLDCKAAGIFPLDDFIDAAADFATFIDVIPYRLATGFLASTPRNPLIVAMMEASITKVLEKDYGQNQLDAGGPQTCGDVLNAFLKAAPATPFAAGRHTIEEPIRSNKYGEYVYLYKDKTINIDLIGRRRLFGEYLCDGQDIPLMKREPAGYLFSWRRLMNRYEIGWITRTCFS